MARMKYKWLGRGFLLVIVLLVAMLFTLTVWADSPGLSVPAGNPSVVAQDDSAPPPDGPGPHAKMVDPCEGPGSNVEGMVWYDGNADDKFTRRNNRRTEHAMDGALVKLWSLSPMPGMHGQQARHFVEAQYARDGGLYKFCGLRPGLYQLEVVPPDSAVIDTLTLPNQVNPTEPFELNGDEDVNIRFGFKPYLKFTEYANLNGNLPNK